MGNHPGQGIDQLLLAVPVYAGNADNLPGADFKIHVVHQGLAVGLPVHGKVFHPEDRISRLLIFLLHGEVYFPAHHHFRQGFFCGGSHINSPDTPALSQDCTAIGNGLYFVQFVGDKQDRLAFRHQVFHDMHQFVNFLGC